MLKEYLLKVIPPDTWYSVSIKDSFLSRVFKTQECTALSHSLLNKIAVI